MLPNLRGSPFNKTTLFMLPAIGFREEKTSLRLLKYYGFINCYISHRQSLTQCQDCLTLVFNPTNDTLARFKEFYAVYRTYPNFVEDYCIDFNLIAVVFKIPYKWRPAFEEFKKSKYSRMSREYSDLFKQIDMSTGRTKSSDEYFIIRKDKDYKKKLEESLSMYSDGYTSPVVIDDSAELADPLDLEKEIFNYESTKI